MKWFKKDAMPKPEIDDKYNEDDMIWVEGYVTNDSFPYHYIDKKLSWDGYFIYYTPYGYHKQQYKKVKGKIYKCQLDEEDIRYNIKAVEIIDDVTADDLWNIDDKDIVLYDVAKDFVLKKDSKEDYELFKYLYNADINECEAKICELYLKYLQPKINDLVSLGYSEPYATILMKDNEGKYDRAVSYAKEGLSNDMRAYLLSK